MFQTGQRVLIKSGEINPLSECFVKESTENRTICSWRYSNFSGEIEVPADRVYKHPITSPSFIYKMDFIGNTIPEAYPFFKNLNSTFSSWESLSIFLKSSIACFKRTFANEKRDGKLLLLNLLDMLEESDAIYIMDQYIDEHVCKFPDDFRNTYILEYSSLKNISFINYDKFYEIQAGIFLMKFLMDIEDTCTIPLDDLSDIIKDELYPEQNTELSYYFNIAEDSSRNESLELFDWGEALEREKIFKQNCDIRGLLNICFDFWYKMAAGFTIQDRFPKICYYCGRLKSHHELKAFMAKNHKWEISMWLSEPLMSVGKKLFKIGINYPNLSQKDYSILEELYSNPNYCDLIKDILFDEEKLSRPIKKV